jgi:tRNA/tmRNA/rRNA uracil-C5-methylase (TrmA/RlmC/RlmD family)
MKKVKYMKSQGEKLDIESIILNNISKSMTYCEKHNIDIIDIYKENKIVNSDIIIKKFFLNYYNGRKIDTQEIQLSVDAIFSITRPMVAKQMCEIIKKSIPSIEYIIDGCANIGTTTLIFAQYFKHVYSIEYDVKTFNILQHNIGLYQVRNATLFRQDTTIFMKDDNRLNSIGYNTNSFILCLDPPWEGVFYKINTQLDLYLSNINILDFLKEIDVKYICIKAPNNYNFTKLYQYFYNVTIYRLGGFYFIMIVK